MKTRKKDFLMALAAAAVLFPSVSFAGPKKDGPAPVAEGYPAWTGITSQNYICGRVLLSGSDLRQKITVVVEIDASKPVEQVTLTSGMPRLNGYSDSIWGGGQSWETFELPRDVMVVYVARNVKRHETLVSALTSADYKTNATVGDLMNGKVPVYENVTFEGAPDNGGKLPFVYVMGMEGKTPLVKEPVGPATLGAVRAAIASERAKVAGCAWRPFYGYVQEPKHFKEIEATLAKGKPLEAYEGLMLKGIASPEPEIAKEAQMLYDAFEQTKSDLIWTVMTCCSASPHVAAYKIDTLSKFWPKEKKRVDEAVKKLKANPDAKPLILAYGKIAVWSQEGFVCKSAAAAKKNVAELKKMKKQIEPLKGSAVLSIQNSAMILDSKIDELIETMPAKVPTK